MFTLSFNKAFIVTLAVFLCCIVLVIGSFTLALMCMGGPACSRMLENNYHIAAAITYISYFIFLHAQQFELRYNRIKVTILTILLIIILSPILIKFIGHSVINLSILW
jgi:hypothetical protein